jgi:hypothetical protein
LNFAVKFDIKYNKGGKVNQNHDNPNKKRVDFLTIPKGIPREVKHMIRERVLKLSEDYLTIVIPCFQCGFIDKEKFAQISFDMVTTLTEELRNSPRDSGPCMN